MKPVITVGDVPTILVLIALEALLSIDNCVVLTLLVQHLPEAKRRKALLYGIGSAFLFRLAFIFLATTLLAHWWLQFAGACYLFYICARHFLGNRDAARPQKERSLLKCIIAVELTDVCFAGDSVMAGVALVRGSPEKIWTVYLGGITGILLLRIGISMLGRLVDQWPVIVDIGYYIVLWVAVRLLLVGLHKAPTGHFVIAEMTEAVFWGGMIALALVSITLPPLRKRWVGSNPAGSA